MDKDELVNLLNDYYEVYKHEFKRFDYEPDTKFDAWDAIAEYIIALHEQGCSYK